MDFASMFKQKELAAKKKVKEWAVEAFKDSDLPFEDSWEAFKGSEAYGFFKEISVAYREGGKIVVDEERTTGKRKGLFKDVVDEIAQDKKATRAL